MTDLERRALMGDRQAQEKCTRQGIVLACPMCGCRAEVKSPAPYVYYVMCVWCGLKASETGLRITALGKWNARPAPPIGRCKDCEKRKPPDCTMYYECQCGAQHTWETDSDFCSEFELKEEQPND